MRGVVHDGGGQRVVRHQVRDGARALVLDDVAVDDGVSGEEPVLEVLLAEHRRQVVRAQKLKVTLHYIIYITHQTSLMFQCSFAEDENVRSKSSQNCLFSDLVEEVACLRDVRGLELPKPLRLRILRQPET